MADTLVGVFTVATTTNRFLIPNHGLIDGDRVQFELDPTAGSALPTPIVEHTYYFVTGYRGNDFMVAGTSGGPAITLQDKGTGSNTAWKHVPGPVSKLLYTGEGDTTIINVRIFGDGVSSDLLIDLTKPPYNLVFNGVYPKDVYIVNTSPSSVKTVNITTSQLSITFETPPLAIKVDKVLTEPPKNRDVFKVYFVYGM